MNLKWVIWIWDSEFFAKGLYWIIEENKKLPIGEKIRVVSVSAAPYGNGSPFTKNLEMWDEAVLVAQNEGILVLDCGVAKIQVLLLLHFTTQRIQIIY